MIDWLRDKRPRLLNVLYWVAVGLTMTLFLAACLHGIANFWQWGHNGYNGAAFAQAARNSIRFDTLGLAQYYTGLEPPPPEMFYTHHPMMLHFHIIALFKLFGYSEWAARLPSAGYSFLVMVMLFVFVKRYWGKAMALATIVAYGLIPLNLIYANMVTHQQGSLFWCLFFIYMYCRWQESARWVYFLFVMLGVTMAVQFDWVAYYVSLFLVTHAFLSGTRRQQRLYQWRREYTFALVFSAVVLLNFWWFYSFIVELRGGFSEMAGAFELRSSTPEGYFGLLWMRSVDLYGLFFIGVLLAWMPVFAVRAARWDVHFGDLIPVFFFLGQLIHSLLFKQAGHLHAYWTYNINPGLAVMAAFLLLGLAKFVPRILGDALALLARVFGRGAQRRAREALKPALAIVAAGIILVPTAAQARYAWDQMNWGFDTGAASYVEPYNDQFYEIRWAQEVASRFDRENAKFLIHHGVQWRIEWLSYLDAPFQQTSRMRVRPSELEDDRHTVFLFDLDHMRSRRQLARLVERHHTWVYDRRFVVVDGSTPDGEFEAFVHVDEPASLLWSWFVNPNRPPIRWEPDPQIEAVQALFATDAQVVAERWFGGEGGDMVEWDCPLGHVLSGFDATLQGPEGLFVGGLQPRCRALVVPGVPSATPADGQLTGPQLGHPRRGAGEQRLECPPGQGVVGIAGRSGMLPDAIGLICAEVLPPIDTGAEELELRLGEPQTTPLFGGTGGDAFEFRCPEGTLAWGFRGRTGALVDAAGIACVRIDRAFLSGGE